MATERGTSPDTPLLATVAALLEEIAAAAIVSEEACEAFRVRYLGQKNGLIPKLFKRIKEVPPQDRREVGQQLNTLREKARKRLEEAKSALHAQPKQEVIDLTLPGRRAAPTGSIHPLTQAMGAITHIFKRLGFSVADGPEIEDDWHNFTALNFPADHPARDMQDTLFVEAPDAAGGGVMLRTHTSPVQIRAMVKGKPPFRLIAPGRVYRNETVTYKSYCVFHQVEGLVVDEGVTMADLKQVLFTFARAYFGEDVELRFRPSFFPFTEPSAELDIWWVLPDHPQGGRWMEILGSGMVDPNVLEAVGIDSERYTGYAFGMGVERPAMLRYGIEDIRAFYENDVRFLAQF